MALPMLVGGADCGPSNPLQGLSKRFDQDRGLQQDYIHSPGRSASSSQAQFRTHLGNPSGADQDAAHFFSSGFAPKSEITHGLAFDVSPLRAALPLDAQASLYPSQMQQPSLSVGWASDFVNQQPTHASAPLSSKGSEGSIHTIGAENVNVQHSIGGGTSGGLLQGQSMQWHRTMQGNIAGQLPGFSAPLSMQVARPTMRATEINWEKEFSTLERGLVSSTRQNVHQLELPAHQKSHEGDELARMAGFLLETVKDDLNPKFQQSQFMGLMKQLRDGDVIVEGNQMVENHGQSTAHNTTPQVDVKGKSRATDLSLDTGLDRSARFRQISQSGFRAFVPSRDMVTSQTNSSDQEVIDYETEIDAYFRQENADYIRYWNNVDATITPKAHTAIPDAVSWDRLQNDWDKFEATASGVKPVDYYEFQHNNPYLIGDSSRTRNHTMHSHQTIVESVLELEAAVQRDMNNASAWLALGVKQQENERERKALQALQHAIELDPSHLPAWLALAVSFTNDGNRLETYNAIHEWVSRNDRYMASVLQFRAQNPEKLNASITERSAHLTQCLIAMARSDTNGEIDADIQIALAVLLNANEDYAKAQDCFRTALAMRPEDWLLYNRVGATMANSGQAEEAVQYYYRALELNPGYIRARFNLGISCINLKRYAEAGQHILDALVLQDNDGLRDSGGLNEKRGVTSAALWDSLKTTCLHMQRVDLATLCDRQDLEAFRNAFQP